MSVCTATLLPPPLPLSPALTSIIGGSCHKYHFSCDKSFVMTKHVFCRNKTFVATKVFCHKTFVVTNICSVKNYFVATSLVTTKVCLSGQNFCCDKFWFIATNICHNKDHIFVMTKDVFCHDKHTFVMTNTCFSQQKFCCTSAARNRLHSPEMPTSVCRSIFS